MAQPLASQNRRPRDLPAGYHLGHFTEMLDFVEQIYGPMISEDARDWVADFRNLSPPAQSLFVRIANRKGRVFRSEHLNYSDVPDRATALKELKQSGFASSLEERDFRAALATVPKAEIFDALSRAEITCGKNWKRQRLVEAAEGALSFKDCFNDEACHAFIVQRRRNSLRFLLYLYFGRIEDSLTRFALRDLGLVRTHSFRDEFEARFESRTEAEESFFYAGHIADVGSLNAREIAQFAASVDEWPAESDGISGLRDTLLFDLGRRLEKAGDISEARAMFERGRAAGCGERAVRLAWAAGERDTVRARLEDMIADPASDSEALFAEDFLTRKFDGKRTSTITDILRAADVLKVDESHRNTPERGAIDVFARNGWSAVHAENAPWQALFGLLFWDALYGADGAALHNAFERLPVSLRRGTFYADNADAIEARLCLLSDPDAAIRALLKTFAAQYDTPNGLFRWGDDLIERLQPLLERAPHGGLAAILRAMAQSYPERKDGFPDLILWRDEALKLVEIKTSNDTLRRNQLVQLSHLREVGFDVAVNRIEWIVDPDQTYVVVDIETTGGRPPCHRVTEIGAVKIKGGETVARWQSLVNPERSIPRMINTLTGISDDMVADAPRFAEIADEFQAFMGDGIFVAHNVKFDHGFLAAEYEMLGRRFRYAQLCTCQSMRTLFKGLPSYSLGNLCRHFDIPLDSHHRALCDAEAAAGLLSLINERRMAAAGGGGQ